MGEWRFYVYSLGDFDSPAYIGKGSGGRLAAQRRKFGLPGSEVARFKSERDAYAFERATIEQHTPSMNRHPGGNGSRAVPRRAPRKDAFEREIEAVGSRKYAARFLLSSDITPYCTPSEVEQLRQVAYG